MVGPVLYLMVLSILAELDSDPCCISSGAVEAAESAPFIPQIGQRHCAVAVRKPEQAEVSGKMRENTSRHLRRPPQRVSQSEGVGMKRDVKREEAEFRDSIIVRVEEHARAGMLVEQPLTLFHVARTAARYQVS